MYGIVARPGNGIYSVASTISDSIDVLYQTNSSILMLPGLTADKDPNDLWGFMDENNKYITDKEVFTALRCTRPQLVHRPILLIGDIPEWTTEELEEFKTKTRRWWHAEILVICVHVVNDNRSGPVTLDDIPPSFLDPLDEIFTLYRPEYYGIDKWDDGSDTQDQIAFYPLKSKATASPNQGRLWLDAMKRVVRSCA
jgi:hypothetical protein